MTFNKEKGLTKFLIYDCNGRFIESVLLPVVYQNIVTPYLYTIDKGKLYQLIENEDDEWLVKISKINIK